MMRPNSSHAVSLFAGVTLLTAALLPLVARGAEPPTADPPALDRRAFDATTGRSLLNYPPHRSEDVRHIRLQLRIPSMNQRTILATETLTVTPIIGEIRAIVLNAALLKISDISIPNRTCTFTTSPADETLTIQVSPPIAMGQSVDATIHYEVTDPPDGLTWTVESAAFPGRAAQLHSQGESESNRYWFACQDFPNSRCTTEVIATVLRGFQVVSNGRLDSLVHEPSESFDTFHWVQDKPHPAYLVSLVVGKFDVVDVGTRKLPMPVYVAPGEGGRVRAVFGHTPKMIDLISRLTDEPYPWAKYAQVSALNFAWGGMENTSATTLEENITLDKTAFLDGDNEDLTVHELGHQWFGDLLTCKSWEHIWLNEGFATYIEALWAQYRDSSIPSGSQGAEGLRANADAYLATVWNWQQDVIRNDTGAAPFQPAMASKEYDAPDEVFNKAANPYPKGALLLHMLRAKLGDETFFRGLAEYVHHNRFKQVETFQFREAMEKAGAVSLQRFFDQWAFRPLVPIIHVASNWDASTDTLNVTFEQHQTIDGYNPAFEVSIPVWVRPKGQKSWTKLLAAFDERTYTLSAKLIAAPDMILIDPELTSLAEFAIDAPIADWSRQLGAGPTLGARLRAAHELGKADGKDPEAVVALGSTVGDDHTYFQLRIEAAKSLGALGAPAAPALAKLLTHPAADARVRSAVIEQAAAASGAADPSAQAALVPILESAFRTDPSYGVRAAAISALGALHAASATPAIIAALGIDSHSDKIRVAAVGALADLDKPESLPLVLKCAAAGNSSFLRPAAAEALGRLAHLDPDRVFNILVALLDDREPKTVLAAGKALSGIGGARVKTLLEGRATSLPSRYWKGQTREWLRDMKEEKAQASIP